MNGTPLLIAIGPDGKSFRVFISRIDGKDAEFFLKATRSEPVPRPKSETPAETDKEADHCRAKAEPAKSRCSQLP